MIKVKNEIKTRLANNEILDKNLIIGYFKFFNYEYLSEGASSVVFEHPTKPYILKVFQNDDAYFNYFEFCLCNQNNPFIPKVKPVLLHGPNSGIVKIEKLFPIDKRDRFALKAMQWVEAELYLGDKIGLPKFNEDLYHKEIGEWIKNNPAFVSLAKHLRSRTKGTGLHFDFHESNIMKRGDQLVITDALIQG